MGAVEQVQSMTLDEFILLYEREGAFELIDGERKPLMPPVAIHGWIIRALFVLLYNHCAPANLGEVFTEMPYVLLYSSAWVKGSRVPDLMFFSSPRWQQYVKDTPDWHGKPFVLVPDLAIEVVSPNDLFTEIQDKVDRYLSDGVKLVWVFDPQRSRVSAYESSQFATFGKGEILEGGKVLPGLMIDLDAVFTATALE